ncbi:glycosyltransferase family 4 protein [Aliamphritea ceti]|uniref:glycosyltransferase family 4 protein n=1 Tax=Aliamphritea ceti TaxID=1524258 RepID=UPI0021C30A2F|nr:glycosyltransferase family 4 protein [Aliamphritea ceti]
MKKIALILKGYPRLSETFIAQEIRALEKRGMDITLVSLRHPTDKQIHPIHRQIQAQVIYLPEYLHQEPLRVLKALGHSLKQRSFGKALTAFWKDLRRDTSRNRIRRFGQALVLTAEMPTNVQQMYAHFLHTPASVTRYSALLNGLPWSCSAHAKDIWTSEEWELREKLHELEWLATCTQANHTYLQGLSDNPNKVQLVYHGLDFERFNYPQASVSEATAETVKIISVGRAVPKKGYDDLLKAFAMLPADLNWHFTHIGGGSLLKPLQAQAEELGLSQRISWLGALPQEDVLEAYRNSDLFVLASKIIADGDRDGLPNVLMEAQSQALCCLATNISGIPELISSGKNGLLVDSESPTQLAEALQTLIRQPQLRDTLGKAGQTYLRENFDVEQGIDQLVDLFQNQQNS